VVIIKELLKFVVILIIKILNGGNKNEKTTKDNKIEIFKNEKHPKDKTN
jgi:hypothetical protein